MLITFDESAKETMLSFFDKTVDKEGFIIEKNTCQRVITPDGEEIRLEEFAGIGKGGVFIKSDLPSLVDLLDTLDNNDIVIG